MLCSLSSLTEQDLRTINDLEKDLGKTLVAFTCHKVNPAEVDEPTLKRIRELEEKLGMALVAVET